MAYGEPELLFTKYSISGVGEAQLGNAGKEIASYDPDRLLNTPIDDLVTYFAQKYRIEFPILHKDQACVEQKEGKVPIFDYFSHAFDGDGRREVMGTHVELTVPFTGDHQMFFVRPNTFDSGPPRAIVQEHNIILKVTGRDLKSEQVKSGLNSTLADIEKYLGWQKPTVDQINTRLADSARQTIEARKAKLLADRNLVAGLGFPMKVRPDAPRTYAAPQVRRKIAVSPPPASQAPFKPEPVLDEANYKAILDIVQSMALVMERSPSAFAEMGEEALRQHFLVQLNGHFEGQATGETFNHQGKTDILIRVSGRNIFIAECKFWHGEKQFTETVSQVLSYLSWRDTKAAIILFNRNKGFSDVLTKIKQAAASHPNRKSGPKEEAETRFRCVFGNPSDPSREIILTVLAFDVPTI
jgi:hypothetical protein